MPLIHHPDQKSQVDSVNLKGYGYCLLGQERSQLIDIMHHGTKKYIAKRYNKLKTQSLQNDIFVC